MRNVIVVSALVALCGCGRGHSQADQLDAAANQSDPAAASVLHNEAEDVRENGSSSNLSAADSPVQDAMRNAGSAQIEQDTDTNSMAARRR